MFRTLFVASVLAISASTASSAPPELSGRWSGYWISDTNGHHGPLHGKFTQLDSETYRVNFHGRFAKIVPFWYSTKLTVVGGDDDVVVLTASRNLGALLGTFQTTAVATGASFDAQFSSRNDSGRFVLTRRR
jgi:hypothetical protein